MDRQEAQRLMDELVEELASIEHERWAHWQRYVHEQATRENDGSRVIPAELADRWDRQAQTPFSELSEAEKESDREQVRRYLPTIVAALSRS